MPLIEPPAIPSCYPESALMNQTSPHRLSLPPYRDCKTLLWRVPAREHNQNKFEHRIQPSDNPASERGTIMKELRRCLLQQSGNETWGNLLEVENVFCSKNLISRVLSHIAFRKRNSKGENFQKQIYLAHYDAKLLSQQGKQSKVESASHLLAFDSASSQGILLPVLVHHLQTLTTHGASFSWRIPKFFSGCPWLGWSRPLQRTESGEDPV